MNELNSLISLSISFTLVNYLVCFCILGLITKEELKEYEASGPINQPPNIIQLTSWAIDIIHNLEASGYIQNSHAVELLILEIQKYRGGIGMLTCFDWISVPLVYTQVRFLTIVILIALSIIKLSHVILFW